MDLIPLQISTASSLPPPPPPPPPPPRRSHRLGRPTQGPLRPVPSSSPKPFCGAITRWSDARFAAAKTKLIKILRSMCATAASSIGCLYLRDETHKHIRNTGLLDHLLKNAVGKLLAVGSDRLRRRHNPKGAMEYWLEPGELMQVRWEVGVTNPLWVLPPGWKLGVAANYEKGE